MSTLTGFNPQPFGVGDGAATNGAALARATSRFLDTALDLTFAIWLLLVLRVLSLGEARKGKQLYFKSRESWILCYLLYTIFKMEQFLFLVHLASLVLHCKYLKETIQPFQQSIQTSPEPEFMLTRYLFYLPCNKG